MARLVGIAKKDKKRAPMVLLQHADVSFACGIADDFRGRPGNRQVTVLVRSDWELACEGLDQALQWTARRANLYINGLALKQSQGQIIQIGTVQLLITRETDPCKRMAEISPKLEQALALDWRGGVCCRVIAEGQINVGDEVSLIHVE